MITTEQLVAAKTERKLRDNKPYKFGDRLIVSNFAPNPIHVMVLESGNKGYETLHFQGTKFRKIFVPELSIIGKYLE